MSQEATRSQLTAERWQQIKNVLAEVIDTPVADRDLFLSEACGGDSALRGQVEDLLEAHEATEAQELDSSPIRQISSAIEAIDMGRRLGDYRLVAELARGGMGTVYRATRADDEYQKQVAIKIVDRGKLSSRSAELFRHERQILAGLEHPNIARLLDGGTDKDGSPYLVMEYVEGETITRYCDAHELSIEERLKLFQKICSAVHYAHQNLVIHRDIKPANILVSASGEPKLLDFGIAKIIDAGDAQTHTLGSMTPAYASPEQLQGQAVTTATDIYSLGLVLYEVLTGRYAYEGFTSPARRQQAILEQDPERPSQAALQDCVDGEHSTTAQARGALRRLSAEKLSKRLTGDVESIVGKAVCKEPELRYNSAAQFSDDISRHLRGEPVIAHRNTLIYRGAKFIRRHTLGTISAFLALAMTLAGVLMIVRAERKAKAEQAIAEQRFNELRKLANSLIFEVHDAIRDLPGATPARKLVVSKALEYLDALSREAINDRGLQRELAAAYQRVGDAQGGFVDANLGDERGALQSYVKAVQLRESLVKADPGNLQLQIELSRTYDRLGLLAEDQRNYPEALRQFQKSLAIMDRVGPRATEPIALNQYAGVHYFFAIALRETGDLAGAVQQQSKAASIRESIQTTDGPAWLLTRTRLAGDYASLADLLLLERDYEHALEAQRKAGNIMSELLRANPQNATAMKYVAGSNYALGKIYDACGNRTEAIAAYRRGAEIFEQVLRSDPLNALASQELGSLYSHFGELQVKSGLVQSGFDHLRKSIAILDDFALKNPEQKSATAAQASAYMSMGRALSVVARRSNDPLVQSQKWLEAQLWLEKSSQLWKTLQSDNAVAFQENQQPAAAAKALQDANVALAKLARRSHNIQSPGTF
jgi:eukaryotic-like serine/threonine-protein kinase